MKHKAVVGLAIVTLAATSIIGIDQASASPYYGKGCTIKDYYYDSDIWTSYVENGNCSVVRTAIQYVTGSQVVWNYSSYVYPPYTWAYATASTIMVTSKGGYGAYMASSFWFYW